ncbi:hypothetical protein EBZ39_03495 [bacterium]|nr:hypothetical protein [bacterium]
MNIHVVRLDLEKTRANWPSDMAFAPAYVHTRAEDDATNWVVLDSPILLNTPPTIADAGPDNYVRIPLFAYELSPKSDLALAYMLQLGLSFAGYLPATVKDFYVVTGAPVALRYDETATNLQCLEYWVGFAVSLNP